MDSAFSKRSYCRFCLSFCGIVVHFDDCGNPKKILGDPNHPISKGYTCKKGRNLLNFYSKARLLQPTRYGSQPMEWAYALNSLGKTIKNVIEKCGPDAVALYSGTNATLDASGAWTALGFMYRIQSNNIYTVASVDAINKQIAIENITSYGTAGLIPQVDFDRTDCLLLVGSNPVVSHGHLAGIPYPDKRIRDIVKRGGNIIVVDPRITKTSRRATLHLRPRPGSDYALLAFVIRELLNDTSGNWIDDEYIELCTHGIDSLKDQIASFDIAYTENITGLDSHSLNAFVAMIKESKHVSGITGTGVSFSDSGIVTEWLLWSLIAIKGKLDRPGGVWFNPGQSQRSRSGAPRLPNEKKSSWAVHMPARHDLRAKLRERPVAGLADEILAGNIKILICVGGNPINAFPNKAKTLAALSGLEALVVLDTHKNELVALAQYGLPVCGPLERTDSTIYAQNSAPQRAVLYTERILDPKGKAKPAWWIFSKLGDELGLDTVQLGKPTEKLTDLEVLRTIKGAQAIFDETNILTVGHYVADQEIPFGWVCDSILPDKRWNLAPNTLIMELQRISRNSNSSPSDTLLIALREEGNLNSQFITGNENTLPPVYIHPHDAQLNGLSNDQVITISSAYGSVTARVVMSENIKINTVGIPHGYGLSGNVSGLTSEFHGINPLSGMVHQTAIPVRLESF